MTSSRAAPAGSARTRVIAVRLGLAAAVLVTELIAASAASESFVLSTIEQERAAAASAHITLRLCALPLVAAAAGYWTLGRSRLAGVLLGIAAVGTALGLWTWLATAPLVLVALVAAFFGRNR